MLLGYLVAKSYDSDEVLSMLTDGLPFAFLLLAIAEIYYHEYIDITTVCLRTPHVSSVAL